MGAEQSSLPDGHEDDERSVSSDDRQGSSMNSPRISHSPMSHGKAERARSPTLSHRNLSSRALSGTASYASWSSIGSEMTKAGLNRALIDDAKQVQAQEERLLKLPREQQRAEEQRAKVERGRARTMAAREQPARVDRAIEAVRRHKAEQGREGREQSARIDRALTARGILDLEQKEDEAAAARERRRRVAGESREEVYHNNVSFANEVPAAAPQECVWEGGELPTCGEEGGRRRACVRHREPPTYLPLPLPPRQGKELSLQLAHMHLEQRETRRMERCAHTRKHAPAHTLPTPRTRPAHAPYTPHARRTRAAHAPHTRRTRAAHAPAPLRPF